MLRMRAEDTVYIVMLVQSYSGVHAVARMQADQSSYICHVETQIGQAMSFTGVGPNVP